MSKISLGYDPDKLEKSEQSPDPGWYRVVIDECFEDPSNAGNQKFTFVVTKGPFEGAKIYDTLYDPASAETPEMGEKSNQKRASYAMRLGLVPKSDFQPNSQAEADSIGTL
jgi:hypothetical protein